MNPYRYGHQYLIFLNIFCILKLIMPMNIAISSETEAPSCDLQQFVTFYFSLTEILLKITILLKKQSVIKNSYIVTNSFYFFSLVIANDDD